MKTYEFTVIVPMLDDRRADVIYSICADSSAGASHGSHYVAFDREAESLEEAIRSAVADLRRAGVEPIRIELPAPAPIDT